MDEKVDSEKPGDKRALFIQRFIAFIIDMVLVLLVTSIVSTPFVNTKKVEKIEKEQKQIIEKFQKQDIDVEEYYIDYSNVYYKLTRNTGIVSIITILLEVIYFVVFQLYNKGQTLGKKIMKIRVVAEDGDLFMNQMIYRSLLSNLILMHIITFILMLFSPKSVFFLLSFIVEMIQYLIMFISVIMISSKNGGYAIHDKLAHTKVIREN